MDLLFICREATEDSVIGNVGMAMQAKASGRESAVLFTEEALAHTVKRVEQVQQLLGRQLVIENVSSYLIWRCSTMTEWEFLSELSRRADCGILLDLNNIYVSARNHGLPAGAYLAGVPVDRVAQYHLAGHTNKGRYILDTHSAHVIDEVWSLFRYACELTGPRSIIVEWDEDIPAFEIVHGESLKAGAIRAEVERARAAA
jgi:hypothetical protein